jgi:hemoglobin-like flavoprotein
MTPEQIAAVTETFAAVGTDDTLAVAFYDALFSARPDLRPLFPIDMDAQRVKFVEGLAEIVRTIGDLDDFEARVEALGVRHHHDYAVRPEHFPPVRDALLEGFRSCLGPAYTPTVEQAWTAAFDLVAETMMDGAAREVRAP